MHQFLERCDALGIFSLHLSTISSVSMFAALGEHITSSLFRGCLRKGVNFLVRKGSIGVNNGRCLEVEVDLVLILLRCGRMGFRAYGLRRESGMGEEFRCGCLPFGMCFRVCLYGGRRLIVCLMDVGAVFTHFVRGFDVG